MRLFPKIAAGFLVIMMSLNPHLSCEANPQSAIDSWRTSSASSSRVETLRSTKGKKNFGWFGLAQRIKAMKPTKVRANVHGDASTKKPGSDPGTVKAEPTVGLQKQGTEVISPLQNQMPYDTEFGRVCDSLIGQTVSFVMLRHLFLCPILFDGPSPSMASRCLTAASYLLWFKFAITFRPSSLKDVGNNMSESFRLITNSVFWILLTNSDKFSAVLDAPCRIGLLPALTMISAHTSSVVWDRDTPWMPFRKRNPEHLSDNSFKESIFVIYLLALDHLLLFNVFQYVSSMVDLPSVQPLATWSMVAAGFITRSFHAIRLKKVKHPTTA